MEVPEVGEVAVGRDLQNRPCVRALEGKRRSALGDVLDRHLQPGGVAVQPAQVRVGSRQAVAVLAEPGDRAVVDLLAVPVAPRRVDHLADLALRDVAGHDPVQQADRVAPADEVFVERRDVEQRRGAADGVVLAVVQQLVGARHNVARPAAPGLAVAEGCGPCVERRDLQHHLTARARRGRGRGRRAGRRPAACKLLRRVLARVPAPSRPRAR